MKRKSYKKTILVTGGAGFIGSHYLNRVVPRYPNYFFINLDALTYAGNLDNIEVAKCPNYAFEHVDITDFRKLAKVFAKYHPSAVVHFAAESHVDVSIVNPARAVETNVLGTQNLLELARRHKIERFLHISTDEVYGSLSLTAPPSRENDKLAPNSPYSASKAAAEMLVRAFAETYGLNTVITRSSNNYGPKQHPEKFIPRTITTLLAGGKAPLYSKGLNVRNWLHVADNVEGLDLVFHKGKKGSVYNLGGETELPNIAVLRIILAHLNKNDSDFEYVTDRPGHDLRYALDSRKAKRELGWKPKKTFAKGIVETIAYYRNAMRRSSPRQRPRRSRRS